MYMLGPDILKLSPSAYTVAQELERYKMGVLKVRIDWTCRASRGMRFSSHFCFPRISSMSHTGVGVGRQRRRKTRPLRDVNHSNFQ